MNDRHLFQQFNTPYHLAKIRGRINEIKRAKRQKQLDRRQIFKDIIFYAVLIGFALSVWFLMVNILLPEGFDTKIDW